VDVATAEQLHDDLLAAMPDGAKHDPAICPFCVEKAKDSTTSAIPPGSAGPGVTDSSDPQEHGGRTTPAMSDTTSANLTQEAHEALVQKAVREATEATDAVLKTKIDEIAELTKSVTTLTQERDDAKSDLTRVNGELDKAQVDLKAAQDEVASLKAEVAKRDEDAAHAETASKRAEQVKNLKLFNDDFVSERAGGWSLLTEDDWAARLEEWKAMKPTTPEGDPPKDDTAMSGSNGNLTKDPDKADDKKPVRPARAVLGLK
jgi:hypothetical protein